jgi:hypothetical protein
MVEFLGLAALLGIIALDALIVEIYQSVRIVLST